MTLAHSHNEPLYDGPESRDDFWTLAKATANAERWDDAYAWLDQAEKMDPLQPQIHYLRALGALHHGDPEEAQRLLKYSLRCDAHFVLSHYVLGNLYFQQGLRREALLHWRLAFDSVRKQDAQHILPYSDDLTVEMLVEQLAARLIQL